MIFKFRITLKFVAKRIEDAMHGVFRYLLEPKHRESPRQYCRRDWVFFVYFKKFRGDQTNHQQKRKILIVRNNLAGSKALDNLDFRRFSRFIGKTETIHMKRIHVKSMC